MEEYNIYCDESCHLEHDGEKYMVIGGIKCPKKFRKNICKRIIDIKEKYAISSYAEIKWNKVSNCNINYFKELVDLFFDEEALSFRAVVIDKSKINNEKFHQTHDDFYYKMYFYCLYGLVSTKGANNIYLDKKDTKGTYKINQLKKFLELKTHDFDKEKIKLIQCVNSQELPILQLTDLLIGAVGYKNRNMCMKGKAKTDLVEYISKKSGYQLTKTTFISESKFNLIFIDLQS